MSVRSKWVSGALVYYETHGERWLDAVGSGVIKYCTHFVSLPTDDTTGDPTEYTMTVVETGAGDSTAVLDTTVDGNLLITTDALENDGVSLQLKGEAFKLETGKPCYFGVRLKLSDATQSDLLVGLCITDTALLGGMTDGAYFVKVDGSTDIAFAIEKDSTATSTVEATADTSYHIYEFYFDGTNCQPYVDGVAGTQVTTNLPDNEELTPSIEFLTGADAAKTCTVDWLRVIQIR